MQKILFFIHTPIFLRKNLAVYIFIIIFAMQMRTFKCEEYEVN